MTQPACQIETPVRPMGRAPFLVWPVARREFYTAIAFALLLPLTWGAIIFGWRAVVVGAMTVGGALALHWLLRRTTRRGKNLLYAHTLVSALMLVALSQALWPPLYMLAAGAAMTGLIWLFGGPGHERVQASLLVGIVLTLLLTGQGWHRAEEGTILARNRLFMGDLHEAGAIRSHQWPRSAEIGGQDAVRVAYPNVVVSELLHHVSQAVRNSKDESQTREQVQRLVDQALAVQLPAIETTLLGVIPGMIGAVSGIGIVLGGLYLAYRHILRPRSCSLFLGAVMAGLVASAVGARMVALGGANVGRMWDVISPGEALTLLFYELLSGDVLLAAAFVLALPGSEPITARGRRVFLVLAGVLAGFLHRADVPVPTTTLVLLAFQPLAPLFDQFFGRRSWLNVRA